MDAKGTQVPGQATENAPITSLVSADLETSKSKRINLTMENMLAASKALSICKNERVLDLNTYSDPVKNYVARVLKSGDIEGELNRLNMHIVAKLSKG